MKKHKERVKQRVVGGFILETVIRESPRRLLKLVFHQGIPFPLEDETLFLISCMHKESKKMKHFDGMERIYL